MDVAMDFTTAERAQVLTQALPYIKQYAGKTVVIKYGGNAMISEELKAAVMEDIVLLSTVGIHVVLVHGGGPEISAMLKKIGKESRFVGGMRYTDQETMDIVEMVLAGKVNKSLVQLLEEHGGRAIGLCGLDGGMLKAVPMKAEEDLGLVGEITRVDVTLIRNSLENGTIPVVATIAAGENDGNTYNINADTVAGEVAAALQAEKLMFLTDIDGVRMNPSDPSTLMSVISVDQIYRLIEQRVIEGGMIPKVMGCIKGIEQGVNRTHIVNGTTPHPIILEIFTDKGIGTMVTR